METSSNELLSEHIKYKLTNLINKIIEEKYNDDYFTNLIANTIYNDEPTTDEELEIIDEGLQPDDNDYGGILEEAEEE